MIQDNEIYLSFIIVNFNSGDYLRNCINSIINKNIDINYEILVIDNASTDDSMIFECNSCTKIYLKTNIGFVKANNIAFKQSKGKFIYFLNPDTILLDPNVTFLIKHLESNPEIGILAPQVLNPDNSIQLTYRKEPTITRLFMYLFGINRIMKRSKFVTSYKMEYADYNKIIFPDWVSGAAFLTRKELFESAGLFDENIFMYWEDVSFCREVRNLCYKIVYYPYSKLIHFGGISSSEVKFFSSTKDIESRYYYFKKYHSRFYLLGIKLMTLTNIFLKSIWEYAFNKNRQNSILYLKLFKKFLINK